MLRHCQCSWMKIIVNMIWTNSRYFNASVQLQQDTCSKIASFDVGNTKAGNARTILKFADVKIITSHIDASKTVDWFKISLCISYMKKNSSSVQRFVFLSETTDADSAGEKSMLEMQSTHEYMKVIDSELIPIRLDIYMYRCHWQT